MSPRIVDIREVTNPISSPIRNAYILRAAYECIFLSRIIRFVGKPLSSIYCATTASGLR
jgi:hypothetical protein